MSSAGAWQPSPCHNTHLQRAQWGLGVTACRHATLPNGSSCTLVPFPLCERAFPDGTSPPSTFPSDRNAPSPPPPTPARIWAQVLAINLYKQMTTGSFFDQPKWEHMWRAAPFLFVREPDVACGANWGSFSAVITLSSRHERELL